jgi:alpha-N-arabinofuranosidase
MVERQVLQGKDLFAVNTFDEPDKVMPINLDATEGIDSKFVVELPPLSWTMMRFVIK